MSRAFYWFKGVRFMSMEDVDAFVKSGWKDFSRAIGDMHPDYDKAQFELDVMEIESVQSFEGMVPQPIPATPHSPRYRNQGEGGKP